MDDTINPLRANGRVTSKTQLSQHVFSVDIAILDPAGIHFRAGQFVNVTVGENTRRQYSIASSPSNSSRITLLVDIGPGGPGSQFFTALQPEDAIEFSAPMGRFGFASDTGPMVFFATGTGMAPFKSMIDSVLERQARPEDMQARSLYLYWGFRHQEDIFWQEYLEKQQKAHENFHYLITLSKPGDEWNGCQGYVQACIDKQLLKKPDAHFYICGGASMVQGVLKFLRDTEVDENRIHFEPF